MDGPPPVDPELTARVHEYRATLAALLDEDLARTSAQAPMADCGSLGVVVVTSPLPMHPTTLLIELTIATYLQRCPALERHAVPIVIVCDGHRPRIDEKSRFKRGAISEEEAARYEQYVAELRQLSARATWPLINCRVVAQTSRVGFAFCVKRGLEELGKPYALVVQHDRPISNTVDLDDLVATLDAHRDIRYINLATRSSLMVSRKHRVLRLPDRQTVQGLRLAPTPFFYDSSHVVRVDWYLRVVYGWHAGMRLVCVTCVTCAHRYLHSGFGIALPEAFSLAQRRLSRGHHWTGAHGCHPQQRRPRARASVVRILRAL